MTDESIATLVREREKDGGRPAIRLLVREALMILREVAIATEGVDDADEAEVSPLPRSIASGDSRLGTAAGRVVNLITDFALSRTEAAGPENADRLSFPPYELDLANETLKRDGAEIPVQAKPFCVLVYMAEHPQRLVKHRELREAVWGPNVISESLLRTHVRALRKALGEGVIETVVGRGYRFAPNVMRLGRAGLETSNSAEVAVRRAGTR